jgi:alkylation response protein AidB-like acyl-CoA dehydrogenase
VIDVVHPEERLELLDGLSKEFVAWGQSHEHDGVLPIENLGKIHKLGILHAAANFSNGGLDGSLSGSQPSLFLQAVRTIARGHSSTAHCYQVHNHALWLIEALATPAQIDRFVRPLTSKFSLLASVGSEPNRVDMYAMNTKARRVDGGWQVNGVKNFATNGPAADYLIVFVAIEGVES